MMEHYNDKEISMQSLQIKKCYQFGNARYDSASLKKKIPVALSIPINCNLAAAKSNKKFMSCKQRINTKTLVLSVSF